MNCPVCHSENNKQCITLENSPVYQHPVPDPAIIPAPYSVNLYYRTCIECSHVFQQGNHQDILEKIYSHHYYTPPPSNIGTTFRDDFELFLKQLALSEKSTPSLLEVGASSGEMLATLKKALSTNNADGFEPNIESAEAARAKGLSIYTEFFTSNTVKKLTKSYDLIYSRHVIEHIFDFDDFFKATNLISNDDTRLMIETPSLDWAIKNNSTVAFHIEHIHVFSEYSLVELANQFGWHKELSTITPAGNLITSFKKCKSDIQPPTFPINMEDMQKKNTDVWAHINKRAKDKKTILWGAGSCGISLISSTNVKPAFLVDGNPDKAGKYFCGFEQAVHFAPTVIKDLIEKGDDIDMLVIISSSFYLEIKENLSTLGWKGEVYIPEIF